MVEKVPSERSAITERKTGNGEKKCDCFLLYFFYWRFSIFLFVFFSLLAEANEAFSSSEEIPQEASDEKNGCGIQPVKLISERSTGQKDKAAKTPGPVTSQHWI